MNATLRKFVELGHHPQDSEDEKLRKSSLIIMSGPFALAGLIWGMLYFANGLMLSGSIPFCYGILSLISIAHFGRSKKYRLFRNSQLFLILILPFLLQVSLGGFVPGSAVIVWAIIAPAGALIFQSVRKSILWFLAYITLVFIAFLINNKLGDYINWNLSDGFINALFVMNIIGLSTIVFMIQYYFVAKQRELKVTIEQKNKALHDQSEKLKAMDEIKSRFFANISHEFRTPLTLILGLIEKQRSDGSHSLSDHESQTMERNAQQLLQLINQLLDLSKLESGELKLDLSKSDLILHVKNITAQFESLATVRDISLLFNGNSLHNNIKSSGVETYYDRDKLHKILTNLISNAVKFSPKQGIIMVNAKSIESEDSFLIEVINTGNEIPKDKLPFIFDRFYQVDDSNNREFEGTGIGLALVKELVELHKGIITATSSDNRTCFTIKFPKIKREDIDSDTSLTSVHKQSELAFVPLPMDTIIERDKSHKIEDKDELKVLIVEDNRDLRIFVKGILEKNYVVIEAVNGEDGLAKAEEVIPDLIISDVMMPIMDGYQLCALLKTNQKTDHIPVIILTAKASKENKLEGLEIGADDYLVKPFDKEELLTRVKNLIANRRKLQLKYQQSISLLPKEVKITSVQQRFIEDVKEIIEKNIDNSQFSVEDLGKEIGMSRSQVHRKLKALTDQSATHFIRNFRLYRASELLKQNAGNITEIAYDVGFSSQTYFSTSFQELFGESPSEYKSKQSTE